MLNPKPKREDYSDQSEYTKAYNTWRNLAETELDDLKHERIWMLQHSDSEPDLQEVQKQIRELEQALKP